MHCPARASAQSNSRMAVLEVKVFEVDAFSSTSQKYLHTDHHLVQSQAYGAAAVVSVD